MGFKKFVWSDGKFMKTEVCLIIDLNAEVVYLDCLGDWFWDLV